MKNIYYSFLIFYLILTFISCGKSTEETVNEAVSKTNNNIVGGSGTGANGGYFGDEDFQIIPEEGTSLW